MENMKNAVTFPGFLILCNNNNIEVKESTRVKLNLGYNFSCIIAK